jgi:hypothetical protein
MERLTRRLEDGRIAADLTGIDPLLKLLQYEDTGYQPHEVAPRRERLNLIQLYKQSFHEQPANTRAAIESETTGPERIAFLIVLQEIFDKEYQTGYADGVKSCKPESEENNG